MKQPNMEQVQVNIAIKKIKEIEFSINENAGLDPSAANITFELTTNVNIEEKQVEMILAVFFSDPEKSSMLMKIKTSNVFTVLELAQFHDRKSNIFNIPDNIIVTLLSLSISHSRALLAKNALGTRYADLYIPIVNPTEVFNHIYNKK